MTLSKIKTLMIPFIGLLYIQSYAGPPCEFKGLLPIESVNITDVTQREKDTPARDVSFEITRGPACSTSLDLNLPNLEKDKINSHQFFAVVTGKNFRGHHAAAALNLDRTTKNQGLDILRGVNTSVFSFKYPIYIDVYRLVVPDATYAKFKSYKFSIDLK